MKETIRISGKDLGAIALKDFCPRCFWIKLHSKGQIPFQIFPGIFSSIDAYTKRVVHAWFDKTGAPPPWLNGLDDVVAYKEPPTYHKFNTIVKEFGINLTGSPDGVFVRRNGSLVIIDYKTAKFTGTQDDLHPMYEAQLNAYAYISESIGFGSVTGLALIYMEPVTDDETAGNSQNRRPNGFTMPFSANVLSVTLDPTILDRLFRITRELWDTPSPPALTASCKDCKKLHDLIQRVS